MNPMINIATHLCLVSDQPTPNITPILDKRFKPDTVLLLISPEKQQQAEWLKQVMQCSGVRVSFWPIDDAMDIEHIRDQIFEILDKHGDSIALNATGGTKPMSIAAYEVFRGLNLPIFYVHPERDRVIWMYPTDHPAFDIEDRIRLPQFLQTHGVQSESINRTAIPKALRELTCVLIRDIDCFSKALGTLNYLAFQASISLSANLPDDKRGWKRLRSLLDLFEKVNLLEVTQNTVQFRDEAARFFVNGGWLEHHVFAVIQKIRSSNTHIHDLAQGLEVIRGVVRNELDVAFLCDNKLHLIECKTKQFKQGSSDVVYKLDALTDALGGLHASSMLISFQPLKKADINRAKQAHIHVCAGRDIQQLDTMIHAWITNQGFPPPVTNPES